MKLFDNIRGYIKEDEFKIIIFDNKINIINYKDIKELSDNKIVIMTDKYIYIEGKNLRLMKLFSNELLISGDLNNIKINE
ncbi:MAG: YabP/YqfC family sporulation protein [Bacilli bacterium]|nr:YabP/YqfC family sporulation protein [Bacilli bacterium]